MEPEGGRSCDQHHKETREYSNGKRHGLRNHPCRVILRQAFVDVSLMMKGQIKELITVESLIKKPSTVFI